MEWTFPFSYEMNKYIIVNATALDRSGALSILQQFVENIPQDNQKWLIFVSPDISLTNTNSNIWIEPIKGVKSMHKRLWWDAIGLKKWLNKHRVDATAAVSLQNTGFNVGKNVPTFIYYHQSIPFYSYNWSPFKGQERTFWFYKNIYPFFVKLFLKKNTKIFVQLNFIKEGFAKCFRHNEKLIEVYNPSVLCPKEVSGRKIQNSEELTLLYPAMPHFYKNHRIIDQALKSTDAKVSVLFTIPKQSFSDKRIHTIGIQSYDTICELYRTCDALLFPSYIETFGLPLLEAAMTGMPIIAADLPYAREALSGYEGVKFVPYNDPQAWAKAIDNLEKGKRYNPIDISKRSGWKELFESILEV